MVDRQKAVPNKLQQHHLSAACVCDRGALSMGWLCGSGLGSLSGMVSVSGILGSVSGILASFWKARWYMALSLALAAAASFL